MAILPCAKEDSSEFKCEWVRECMRCESVFSWSSQGKRRFCESCTGYSPRWSMLSCVKCGCTFSGHGLAKYCGSQCRPKKKSGRSGWAKWKSNRQRNNRYKKCDITPRECKQCGNIFLSKLPQAALCSAPCRNKYRYRTQSPMNYQCVQCGKVFQSRQYKATLCGNKNCLSAFAKATGALATPIKKWASRSDRDRYFSYLRRSVVMDRKSEKFSAVEIFERDGWRCGICMKPVSASLRWPNPKSASLDHIVPISRGGHHVRANVQLSHLGCNSRKSASDRNIQLRLFG